ncbi:MAG: glycosyltransferase family 4 protein [Lachnospiraceae bacterium]|nr:glycosyltransferase family 4 protein [Lachnospiraceae bacterium]
MNILVVSHEYPPVGGGGANACLFLTKGYVQKGHKVTIVTVWYSGLKEYEVVDGVEIFRVRSKRAHKEHCSFLEMLSYILKALPIADRLQKEKKFEVCQVFFGIPSGLIGWFLKKKYKLPYVIRFGGGDIPGFQERFTIVYKLIGPAIKTIWKNAAALVANSQGLKDMALKFFDKKEIGIIYNGVDTEVFYPLEKAERDEIHILFVSRLIERKGLQYIIPQLNDIQNHVDKKIKLLIVGDGPYRETLEQLAEENHVQKLVQFVGQKDKSEIVPYYQDADLFILPSAREGMPNVVLEAMACGLPIIMTPCEGSKELVEDNGYIVQTNEFQKYIVRLIVDSEKRKKMGAHSRELVNRKFTWNRSTEQYIELLDEKRI